MFLSQYRDVIGKKIMFHGREAIVRKFEQNYEGGYIYLDFGIEDPFVQYLYDSRDGGEIIRQMEKLQKEMKKKGLV